MPVGFKKKKKKIRSRVPVFGLASRKPVRIRQSGRIGIRGVTLEAMEITSDTTRIRLAAF